MPWKCVDCGKETNTIVVLDLEKDLGRCMDCEEKRLLETFPPPPIEDMQIIDGMVQWPHNYIPSKCPYCGTKTTSGIISTDEEHDRIIKKHLCNTCGIDFGDTD
jgi:DNA-directed RNA polymerase subunit RPC12/RpoP